jgi:enoyl-CoA hydratase
MPYEPQPGRPVSVAAEDYFSGWEEFAAFRTPKIAAVNGLALGGGCELAMMCDLIIAGESAAFGQPEIRLGVIPGIGGTQRLTRLVGRAKAMDLILTGRMMDAHEAERAGLVSRVVPDGRVLPEALEAAMVIASYGRPAVTAARECVDRALETGLGDGVLFERRVFHGLFATEDQKEGMSAFLEKRAPVFRGR